MKQDGMQAMLSQLRLLQLSSPSLPVGAFSYSQGLEKAVELDLINNTETCQRWLSGLMRSNLLHLDLPLLSRCLDALENEQPNEFLYWNDYALASRETAELYAESVNMAWALKRVLNNLQYNIDQACQTDSYDWLAMYAYAGQVWKVPQQQLLLSYVWSWLENQVAAAIKLVPLGQTQGQQILHQLSKDIPDMIRQAQTMSDEEIGSVAPMFAMMSALHETQYTRLFRS